MEDPSLPTYTPVDDESLETRLADLQAVYPDGTLTFPLTQHPSYPYYSTTPGTTEDRALNLEMYVLQSRIIASFHTAITNQNTEAVTLLLSRGLISPDIPSITGATPLITAIVAGSGPMVCTLIGLGADPDAYGTWGHPARQRTPLQVAAATGNLALAKLLIEDFGVNDAEIAPDGQLALRLAAEGGHRELVDYLPARRGGAWRRWKTHHEVAVRRAREAAKNIVLFVEFIVYRIPRFFLWTIPKETVQWGWKNKGKFGGWCKRAAKAVPRRVVKMAKEVARGIKRIPEGLVKLGKWIGRVVAAIPKALKMAALWVWGVLSKMGKACANAVLRVVAVLHTAVMAVVGFFRSITLKDVYDGICHALEAIFILFPKAVWSGIKSFGEFSYKFMKALFGTLGQIAWWLARIVMWLVIFIPSQLGKIITSMSSSVAKAFHEILVWFNPKR